MLQNEITAQFPSGLDRRGLKSKNKKKMTEPYILQINGCNCLILASCLSEAKYKAKRMNGKIKGRYDTNDYKIIKKIKDNERAVNYKSPLFCRFKAI